MHRRTLLHKNTVSASFWESRVPDIGFSMNEKLNPSATAAFRVSTVITGAGTETDIGFVGNNVDWSALSGLGSDLYLHTLYNQGSDGSSWDVIPKTANRATVRSSGVNVTINSTEALDVNTRHYYSATPSPLLAHGVDCTILGVVASLSDNVLSCLLCSSENNSGSYFRMFHDTRTAKVMANMDNGPVVSVKALNDMTNNTQYVLQVEKGTADMSCWVNDETGDQNTAYAGGAYTNDIFRLFAQYGDGSTFDGWFQNIVIYDSVLSDAERNLIRDHFETYYNITF